MFAPGSSGFCTGLVRRGSFELPYSPDFRWLLDRDDSPWYPTMRLFRQRESRDWNEQVDRVRAELALLVKIA